jgi:hypothetical protein
VQSTSSRQSRCHPLPPCYSTPRNRKANCHGCARLCQHSLSCSWTDVLRSSVVPVSQVWPVSHQSGSPIMDPMDYMLPNNHNRPSGQYDPVHSSSNHWSSHPQSQNNPPYPWPTQNPSLPQLYSHHYGLPPGANSIPDSYSHNASMLPPMLGLSSSSAFSGSMPGPMPPRPNGRTQPYRSGMPVPASPITSSTGDHSHHDTAFANQIPANRPDFQAPMFNLGMPPLGPSQEVNSLHRSAYAHHDSGANSMSHSNNNNYFSHFTHVPQPPQPYNPTSSRRGHMSAASITSRPFGNIPSPTSKFLLARWPLFL